MLLVRLNNYSSPNLSSITNSLQESPERREHEFVVQQPIKIVGAWMERTFQK